jgi:(4S)-4-hydroxy-5-phosphonooxypentane-2,3-dione isomerase
MFVAAVTIELLNPHDPIFMQAVLKNAGASRLESGCRRFDVSVADDGASVLLYEVYVDRSAFQTHRATAHFADYDRVTKPLIRSKDVKTYTLHSA